MGDRLDDLERRIDELRAGVRRAMRARDTATARGLRADLRAAERAWDALVSGGLDPAVPGDAPTPSDDAPAHPGDAPTPSDGAPTHSDGASAHPGDAPASPPGLPGDLASPRDSAGAPAFPPRLSGAPASPRDFPAAPVSPADIPDAVASPRDPFGAPAAPSRGPGSRGPGRLAVPGASHGGGREAARAGARARGGGDGLRLVTVREQAHQALTLLGVPAQPRLIAAVREAFFGGGLRGAQLTSLRRDEERSFTSSPYGRPYYLCAALTDRLSPARGLLAVSTWPLEQRMVGPLSPRVHFLACAVAVAERMVAGHGVDAGPDSGAARLLARMARNIPGGADLDIGPPDPARVIEAARAELAVHAERDTRDRAELARRAAAQLGDRARLFGAATLSTIGDRAATGPPAT
ncbi:hypothetical protein [Nonomuraea roseoviolacea]|uniref:Uncharacterized protein n=1 Tax=Nonomuraea roseoviolacea subsp. carminata TaxID=160689 RepID=A0ABT1KH89_9ACTN|nr:hypothetical protein [Nonomuraea roseoviolacea]MCP2352339.1 hypothetical protein [Nonomuraea roseoviolacea subsp. carminata]